MSKRENTVVVPKDTVVKTEAIPFLLHDGDFLRPIFRLAKRN